MTPMSRAALLGVVLGVGALATSCTDGSRLRSAPDGHQALADRIDALVSDQIRQGPHPGASIAVASDGKVLLAKGYGLADVAGRVPARPHTVYRIGSLTKQFTAAAVMDLVERGSMAVDDEVTRFLPDYPTQGHHLTVRHLLTHTSGIRSYTEIPQFRLISNEKVPREELVRLFAGDFDFAPGQQWAYSNSNYFLLGLIIEKASGSPFERYLNDRIFGPLHMGDTSYCPDEPSGRDQARGYEFGLDHRPQPSERLNMQHPFAAGGLCSTVEDLVRWNEAFHGHRFLTAASYELMTTPAKLDNGTAFPYGFGLSLDSVDGSPMISHDGGIPGFASSLAYFPEEKLTLAVLVNNSSGAGENLIGAVMKARSPGCAGKEAPPLRAPTAGPDVPINGGFETGDLTGWTAENQAGGHGDWFVYAGATSPLSCSFIGAAPEGSNGATSEPCGRFRPGAGTRAVSAATSSGRPVRCIDAEDGPGSHVLYQDISLPAGMAHQLSFFVYYRNQAGRFASPATLDYHGEPNQQYRVDILKPSAEPFSVEPEDILATVFHTQPGDPPTLSPTAMAFDLSPFAGTTVRLRFAEVDNMFMLQAAVDAVRITSRSL